MWTLVLRRMLYDELPSCIISLLPPEIWKIIYKFYIKKCLFDHLQFPIVITRRLNDDFFADHWQAYCGGHRWDIESANEVNSTLISHFFNQRRSSIDWSGMMMLMDERIFGVGFNIGELFINTFLDENDIPYFPRIAWTNYDSDDSFLLEEED